MDRYGWRLPWADPIDVPKEGEEIMHEELVDFATVLRELKAFPGKKFKRKGWNHPDQWIALQLPDENSKMTLPYIYIKTVQGGFVPWLASQTDMLAEDWMPV